MLQQPDCTLINHKNLPGILLVDCPKSKIKKGYVFASTVEACEFLINFKNNDWKI